MIVLTISSLIFYGYYFPPYLLLLIVLVLIADASVRWELAAKGSVALGVSALIAVLFFFKYSNFFAQNLNQFFEALKAPFAIPVFRVALPLGISFITFQLISYVVDVKRGKYPREENPLNLLLFIGFFPHQIAGPICRAHQLLPQLKQRFVLSQHYITGGITLFCIGLFLKTGIADTLAAYVDPIFDNTAEANSIEAFWGTIAYGLQIYCDFWGYSTMALGAALIFGINLPLNFNSPYIASSLQEFWRRWHITLSQWLRDYLYISLGGNRFGTLLTYRNLVLTMVLGGLWHGANWTFLVWGLIHGIVLSAERAVMPDKITAIKIPAKILGWLATMTAVFIAWIFFRATNFDKATQILSRIFEFGWLHKIDVPPFVLIVIGLFLISNLLLAEAIQRVRENRLAVSSRIAVVLWLGLLTLILSAETAKKFIYFDF